jgi:hypothetical protein
VVVGDFNADRTLDLAVIDYPYISVLLGNGDGTFQAPSDNRSFYGEEWLAVGDFNNDGNLDVVTTGSSGSTYAVGVLLGNGTLQDSITTAIEYTPAAITTGDLNGDGSLDAILSYDFSGVAVLLGNGDGTFQPAANYDTTGLSGGPIVAADLNLSGKMDFAIQASSGSLGGVDIFWGNDDGTFQSAQFVDSGESGFLAVADLNGDHRPDFALVNADYITTMLNTGAVIFSPTAPLDFPVQVVDTNGGPLTVKLTNSGKSAISFSSINLSGPFQMSNRCGISLAVGANCSISATFRPKSAGVLGGLITILDSASPKPQFVELTGNATAVKISPTSLNFGRQKVGTKSAPQTVTATNVGGTSIQFGDINILGADYKDFSESNTCTGQIAPGASCKFTVIFDPKKTGARNAMLYPNLPLGSVSPLPVTLKGDGT